MEKISSTLPINVDKTYWDFIEKPLPDKTKKLITFFCVPKDVASSYVKFCNSIGLEVTSLSIESLSLARVILKNSLKQSLIMDIGSRVTSLCFFDNNMINMSVTIPIAGEQMTQAIKSKLKIEDIEAEEMKIKFGFQEGEENTVRSLILPVIENILKEAQGAIDYYEGTFKQKLDDIYIVGGSALLPAIIDVIRINLKRDVILATNAYNIKLNLLSDKDNKFLLFANVIGLSMLGVTKEFKDINFLKKMPSSLINSADRPSLSNIGYLNRMNIFKLIFNKKLILVILLIIIGIVSYIIFQQGHNRVIIDDTPIIKNDIPINQNLPLEIGTTTEFILIASGTSQTIENINVNGATSSTSSISVTKFNFIEDKNPGSYGESVTKLQELLTKEGYYGGLIGGFFGPATEAALKAYQKAHNLTVTGKLDSETRIKLND
jgi:Ethanolamine utilization protein EutJ (predicted chaperonin)